VRVLQELATAVGADAGASLYLDDGDGELVLAASIDVAAPRRPRWPRIGRKQLAGRTLVMPLPDESGGMVVLERSTTAAFTRDDRALVKLYVRQLVDEIVASSASHQSVWARQLETIQRIAAQLTRLASTEDVARAVCRETRRILDYDEAHVLLKGERDNLLPIAAEHRSAQAAASPLEAGPVASVISRVLTGGTPLLVPELAAGEPGGRWTVMVVPLRYEERVTGAVCLIKLQRHAFGEGDVRLLQILADQAAVAIENSRLLVKKQELVRELNALLDISNAANRGRDEVALAAVLASKVRQASRMDACRIWRVVDGTTMLRPLATDGLPLPQPRDLADEPARRQALLGGQPAVAQLFGTDGLQPPALGRSLAYELEFASADERGFYSVMLLPLIFGGRSTGLIELFSRDDRRWIDRAEMHAYQTMAGSVASGLENARLLSQLRVAADVDLLTGVNNHRYLQDRLQQETARSARSGAALCVLMLDLDNFKPINDRFGHSEGDEVLRSVAVTIRGIVRTNDIVARYGGDEFVVVMPDTPRGEAQAVANRLVAGIRAARHELSNGDTVSVGASAGLADYPGDGLTAAALLQAADASMYRIKRDARRSLSPAGREAEADQPPVAIAADAISAVSANAEPGQTLMPAQAG
jgi:diguanylate cyclase (GGDEF)-like protein